MSIRYLDLSGAVNFWTNIKNYILSKIPTKTSELTNDSGFLTQHQSLSNYVTLNSNQTITAIKTITGGNQGKMIFKNPNYTKGDALESNVTISRLYFGNNASYDSSNAVLTTDVTATGISTVELCAINNTASNSNRASLILSYDKSATSPRLLKSWGNFVPYSSDNYTLGSSSSIWKECYSNAYYLGTTAFGDIVTHNASEFLTSHQSLANYVTTNTAQDIEGDKNFKGLLTTIPNGTIWPVTASTTDDITYLGANAIHVEQKSSGKLTDLSNGAWSVAELGVGCFFFRINSGTDIRYKHFGQNTVNRIPVVSGANRFINDVTPNEDSTYSLGTSSLRWSSCYSNAYYLGTTAFGDIVTHNASEFLASNGKAVEANKVQATIAAGTTAALVQGTIASNDCFRIAAGGAANAGWAEIATGDDANEPIYVRQYKGSFTTLQRTATLLDGSGNTSFPGTVTATGFSGPVSDVPSGTTYVSAVADGGAVVNSQTTGFGAIWRAPTKNYQVAAASWPSNGDSVYICYSVANTDVTAGNNTVSKSLIWNAGNGTLTTTTFSGALSGNASSATEFSAAKDVTLTGDVTGTASSKAGWSVATTLANSGVTAGDYGPSEDASPAHSGTFTVPSITVDAKGRVTAASTKTITLPADSNTDTKVTQTVTTANSAYPVLLCATANATATETTTSRFSAGLTVNTRYSLIYMTNKHDTVNTKGVRNTSNYSNGVLYFRSYDETQMGIIRCESNKGGYQQIYMMASNYIKNGAIDPEGTATTCSIAVRVRDNGGKTIYTEGSWENSLTPYANETYDIGTPSLRWMRCYCKNFYGSYVDIAGRYLENEYSTNARTCLYLKSNRDTDGKSGIYFSKFRQNRAQGALTGSDLVDLSLDVLENSVRTNSCISISFRYFENDVPTKIYVIPKASATSYMGTANNPWTNAYITNLILNGNAFDPTSVSGNIGDIVFASAYYSSITGTASLDLTVSGNTLYLACFDNNTLVIDSSASSLPGTWKFLGRGKPTTTSGNADTKRVGLWKRIA